MKVVLHEEETYFDPVDADIAFRIFWIEKMLADKLWFQNQLKQIRGRENANLTKQETRSV